MFPKALDEVDEVDHVLRLQRLNMGFSRSNFRPPHPRQAGFPQVGEGVRVDRDAVPPLSSPNCLRVAVGEDGTTWQSAIAKVTRDCFRNPQRSFSLDGGNRS